MSKTTELHDLPLTQETPATQTQHETFNAFLNAPVTKLDADEYMAKDIDGVTESLLGSGNLNFLMMQAGQTDEAMANANPFDIANNDMSLGGSILGGNSYTPIAGLGAQNDLSMDRPVDSFGALDGLSGDGTGAQNNNMGTLGASSAAANSQSINPLSDASSFPSATIGGNGSNGNNGNNGTSSNGTSGVNGTNGTSGTNGTDGEGGSTTVINNYHEDNNYYSNTDIDIFEENFLESVENIYNETTNLLTELTENTFNTVNNVINNIFEGNPLDIGPIGLNLDAALDDLLDLDLDLINGDQILTVLDEVVDLSPVTNLVEGLTGDLIADLGVGVLLDPFQYDNSANDQDIHVGLDILDLGIPDIDIGLNPLEFLLGDIDAGIDLGEDILDLLPPLFGGADNGDTNLDVAGLEVLGPVLDPVMGIVDAVFNPLEDLAGDVDILGNLHVDLLGLGSDSAGPDTDIVIPLDIALIDNPLVNDVLEVGLDPVENLIGDIDLDLGAAGNILGDMAPGLIDNLGGGTGTDNILSGLGDTLSGTVDGILPLEGSPGDTDLVLDITADIPGLDLIPGTDLVDNTGEVILDPVENILGDIDIDADTGINLFDVGDDYSSTDTDLVVDLGGIGGVPEIPVDLGIAESIVGDIDLEVTVSQDVIDTLMNPDSLFENIVETVDNTIDTAVNLLDSLPASTGGLDLGALLPSDVGSGNEIIPSWTQSLLPDSGSLLGGGLLGGVVDALPDPVAAAPVIPLPIIPIINTPPANGGGLFGGLFG